ncbi:MAG: LTA synthase family protein [Saprospiraceae bacterium]|nr:LTA synthase family protein [Saprospiraceae bacterium]
MGKNIVFIILEGWSADMVSYLGGNENVTPFFDSLSLLSVKFTNAFSTGFRTDQGLMSIQSGVPSIQSVNMPNVLDKVMYYPSLCKHIETLGYNSSFIYGGDLNFSNLSNYLILQGFDTIISEKSFDTKQNITDWGIPDHIMLEKAVTIIDRQALPFFSTALLLSSHSPFDVPWPNEFTRDDIATKYKSSVRYSDQSLRQFFNTIKHKVWFQNTVFFITSDHGSTHSGYAGMEDHNRFRIPMIAYTLNTDSVIYNRFIEMPCNHFDLPFTVVKGLGIDPNEFRFGRDMFCQDSLKMSYWNTDSAAGCYGLKTKEIVQSSKAESKKSYAILFLDAVKVYFNNLK